MEDKSIYNKKKTGRKTRQKGFGWYGSLNPNAGDVEKNIEIFNAAQPDGGIGAVSPVNGNAMGESVDNKPDWEGLKNHLKSYLKDKHLKWNISDIGEDAPNFGIGEDNYPEFFKILDDNNFGGTDKVNKLIDYINNQIKNVNESFNYQMDNGMVEDSFYTFERDHLTYHFFFNPRRSEKGEYAILVIDYGWRFDKEPYTDEKGITTIPVSRVHDKPQQIAYFEFTEESHPEIVDAMYEDDRKNYRDLIVAEAKKHMNEGLNEATAFTRYSYTGPIYHLGNKIAEKSRMFTMAKSFAQARNNFTYKAANGDIIGHYDIVDEFIKEVPKTTLDDKSTIEEKPEIIKCEICGAQLNPMGECPVCDYGENNLFESIHIDSNLDALSQLNRMDEIV